MFLEQPNHIPEEYHKYFGIQPIQISSPRSESNTLVTNPEDDENSNSMMSANSEKEGLGAQMVLEQNLGNIYKVGKLLREIFTYASQFVKNGFFSFMFLFYLKFLKKKLICNGNTKTSNDSSPETFPSYIDETLVFSCNMSFFHYKTIKRVKSQRLRMNLNEKS